MCVAGGKMSGEDYDVLVIGAGPAGSYAAYRLAAQGYKVAVLEQKKAAGEDVCCSGIISVECFDSFGIDPAVILTRASSASFFSPGGRRLRLSKDKAVAYVVDRSLFDVAVADKAQAQGARYFCFARVVDVMVMEDSVRVEVVERGLRRKLEARALVVAGGFKPGLSQKLGLGRISRFAVGAQAEVLVGGLDEVEIYFSQQTAPGFFAWLVPVSGQKALAGVMADTRAGEYLEKFLAGPFCRGRVTERVSETRQKPIPIGSLPRVYRDRVLVVGDAAGQVKPTTGGGIYLGSRGVEVACETLGQALKVDDLSAASLAGYGRWWRGASKKELAPGYRVRRLYGRLSDRQIERLFAFVCSSGMAEALLRSPSFSFDLHSGLIRDGLKYALTYPLIKAGKVFRGKGGEEG